MVGVGGGSGGDCEVARRVELLLDGVDEPDIPENPQEAGGEAEDEDNLWIPAWEHETENDETVLNLPTNSRGRDQCRRDSIEHSKYSRTRPFWVKPRGRMMLVRANPS